MASAATASSESAALSFVRNNPFVQNDLAATAKRHYPASSSTSRLPQPPLIAAPTVVVVHDRSNDIGILTPSEIEYGPGIVRKLREKFSHLATTASKDANMSTYSRHKRFPSVDDLLADEPLSKTEEKRLSREHSKSIGSLADLEEQERKEFYNLQQEVFNGYADAQLQSEPEEPSTMAVESVPTPPLSILRQKFELNSNGGGMRPARNSKLAGLIVERRAQNQKQHEPEFLAVSKKLRRVVATKTVKHIKDDEDEPNTPSTPIHLEKDAKLVVDVTSPPDPAANHNYKGEYKFVPERPKDLTDRSPPPEEPRPPVFNDADRSQDNDNDDESELSSDDQTSYDVSPVKTPTTPVIANDGSGIGEMQQLLNKFNSIRERKSSVDLIAADPVIPAEKPPLVSLATAKVPVAPVVAPTTNGHSTLIEISADDSSPKRKSLSAQFLESKQKQTLQANVVEEKPQQQDSDSDLHHTVHVEHVEVHPPVEVAHHPGDKYPPEISAIDYDRLSHVTHEQVQIAGDGNPVRHSLLSLVSEEDVPMLLEAMAERFLFVFEDLNNNNDIKGNGPRPTASSLVRRGQQRRNDQKKNGITGVCFATEPPAAFAYLDETGAVESDEWVEGVRISYDDYERICAEEREDYANKRMELLKWQASLISQQEVGNNHAPLVNGGLTAFVPSQLSSNEYDLGVTNRFSYGDGPSAGEQRLQSDRPSAIIGQSGDGSVDVRPIAQEADSFSQVENASDLLF